MEMGKNTVIKAVEMSFKKQLDADRLNLINPKFAEELLRHTVQQIQFEQTNYHKAVQIARDACSQLIKLKGRKKDLDLG